MRHLRTNRLPGFGSRIFYSMIAASTFEMLVVIIALILDTVIAGYYFGKTGIEAVNLVVPVLSAMAFVSLLNNLGTANRYSMEIGHFEKQRADEVFGQGLIAAAASGILLFALTILGENLYFSILNPPPELLQQAKAYYRIYPFIVLIEPMTDYLTNMIYTDGDESLSTVCFAVRIIANSLLSIFLCGFLGMTGIAIGSLLADVLSLFVALLHFGKKRNTLHFVWYLSIKDLLAVWRYGVSDGVQYLSLAITAYVLNAYVSARFGAEYLTVVTLFINLIEFSTLMDGIGSAITPIVNVYLSERNNDGVRDVMRTALHFTIVEGLVLTVLTITAAPRIPRIYSIDASELWTQYQHVIAWTAVSFLFLGLKYLYSSYYVILGNIGIASLMNLLQGMVLPLLLGIPLSHRLGLDGLWIGAAIAPLFATVLPMLLLFRNPQHGALPLCLNPEHDHDRKNFEIVLTGENIVELRDAVTDYCRPYALSTTVLTRIQLLLEEYCLLVHRLNPNRRVHLQCSVHIGSSIQLILRDTGVVFDLTDPDPHTDEMSAMVIKALMKTMEEKKNLTTIGNNRNVLVFSQFSFENEKKRRT